MGAAYAHFFGKAYVRGYWPLAQTFSHRGFRQFVDNDILWDRSLCLM